MKMPSIKKTVTMLCAVVLNIGALHAAITSSPKSQAFDANGGTKSFTLTVTGGNFSYRTPFDVSASWITFSSTRLSISSGSGTLTVDYIVSPNTSSSSRTGYISGTFGGESFRFDITQSAASGSNPQTTQYRTIPVPSDKSFGVGYASQFKISSSEMAIVIGVCGLTWADFPVRSYDGYRAFVDSRIPDREKKGGKSASDHTWCVEYSYVDLLSFAGWGAEAGYSGEDSLGAAVLSAGEDPVSFVERKTGKNLDYYTATLAQDSSFLASMDTVMENANGWLATASWYENYTWYGSRYPLIGHGIAICGFSYDPTKDISDPKALKGLFVVESDNDRENGAGGASAPDTITYCPVSWNSSYGRYQISNVFGTTGYLDSYDEATVILSKTTPSVVTVSVEGVEVKCKVTFGKNGGTGGDNYVTATYGKAMPTPRTAPTRSGWAFGGYWDTTSAGGKQYYDANMKSVRNWDKTSDTTLWAKWTAAPAPSTKTYKVTFGKNGGTGGDSYVTATYGKAMPTPRTAPTKAGWTFGGYWDTLACDAKGNPLGKQYYNSKMESVRTWDKNGAVTLWAKWTVRVKLGKNGGTGGDDYVTVIYGQPFPTRAMPTKSGYTFGGYFISASSKTGQCYNADGTGTSSMKWTTGGTPTIWALWLGSADLVESFTVGSKAASYYVDFWADKSISYTSFKSSASWLNNVYTRSYTNTSGKWELDVCYSVDANTSSSPRTATITGTVGSQKVSIAITQSGK